MVRTDSDLSEWDDPKAKPKNVGAPSLGYVLFDVTGHLILTVAVCCFAILLGTGAFVVGMLRGGNRRSR